MPSTIALIFPLCEDFLEYRYINNEEGGAVESDFLLCSSEPASSVPVGYPLEPWSPGALEPHSPQATDNCSP
ncbi:hypothetical protein RRG08_065249 [Elysia crispata]|uniref:Uncharacterized protein n=1 Tax=Elysia crispata TaxID=231223 RepID=A0AAE1CZ04_9GAST|nr:hypothetical protein RRG08_065249 [Elysia crispata]